MLMQVEENDRLRSELQGKIQELEKYVRDIIVWSRFLAC